MDGIPQSVIPGRQIHLDFHTSPHIPDVAADFDAEAFSETVEAAQAQSVTIFAKCHHGLSYYPSKTGVPHPALHGRDLMGEQIEALHRRGIRCPLYYTVGWEEEAAMAHPDWRQLDVAGHSIRAKPELGGEPLPGGWFFMNWLQPEYQDFMETQVIELLTTYPVDGLFFDIVVFDRSGGWSPEARRFREKSGTASHTAAAFDRFLGAAQAAFTEKFTHLIQSKSKAATVFYNCAAVLTTDHRQGIRNREAWQSHFELESLPTGHWGYYHFPRIARFVAGMGRPWIGQTGRFQKSWGDFGGIKPQAALEYECFRSQALCGGVEVGDQLPPRGVFDPDAIELIGSVFTQVREAEAFYAGAHPYFDAGIVAAGCPGCDWPAVHCSESGAVLLTTSARRSPVLLDDSSAFEDLPVVILPDSVVVTDRLADVLKFYYEAGGRLVISHRSGFDESGRWRLDFLPFDPPRPCFDKPTYWSVEAALSPRWARAERVLYSAGMTVESGPDTEVLIQRVLPYFQRTDAHFCSHFQAPPGPGKPVSPALIAGKRFLYFADPIFREYRQSAQIYLKEIWTAALQRLLGNPLVDPTTPPSLEVIPARSGQDLLLTLLRYLPVRKALEIDVIDEPLPMTGERLHLDPRITSLLTYPAGEHLEGSAENGFTLLGKGRLLAKAPGFFA